MSRDGLQALAALFPATVSRLNRPNGVLVARRITIHKSLQTTFVGKSIRWRVYAKGGTGRKSHGVSVKNVARHLDWTVFTLELGGEAADEMAQWTKVIIALGTVAT